jgi:Ca-activated chloride channel family protein
MMVKLRYKPKGEQHSRLLSLPVAEVSAHRQRADYRFAAAVAGYGMLLTNSEYLGGFTWEQCLEMIRASRGSDPEGYRAELYRLVEASQLLAHQQGRGPIPRAEEVLR